MSDQILSPLPSPRLQPQHKPEAAPGNWRFREAKQQPVYEDPEKAGQVLDQLALYPPLVYPEELIRLREKIAPAAQGQAFILQGGDCAESFDEFNMAAIRDNFAVLLRMAVILTFAGNRPVVKITRSAGQYAKPRSSPTETDNNVTLPSYFGDLINRKNFTAKDRAPDPERMIEGYFYATATAHYLRSLAEGGYADLQRLSETPETPSFAAGAATAKYRVLQQEISRSLDFIKNTGLSADRVTKAIDLYISHEALLLPYEEALTRFDPVSQQYYAGSAHFLWIGNRTRDPEGAHIEYAGKLLNPVGVKCGPDLSPDTLLRLVDKLNPQRLPGKLTFISRMGQGKIDRHLKPLLKAAKAHGINAVWCCDAMHGNTISNRNGSNPNGVKTRDYAAILSEIREFFICCGETDIPPGGIHLEMTGKDVTECLGGPQQLNPDDLALRYHSACDPRLNGVQAQELAFEVARLLKV